MANYGRRKIRYLTRQPVILWLIILNSMLLFACSPRAYSVQRQPSSAQAITLPTIYFYPSKGQSKEQQDRDHFECYQWAVKQSGFDPSQAQAQTQLAPHQRIEVKPSAPPGADTAAGAIGGAMVGSMLSSRHDRPFGTVFGAITGAMIGAASDEARQREAEQIQQQYEAKDAQQYAKLEKQSRDYQRAITACLEGRGYTVR